MVIQPNKRELAQIQKAKNFNKCLKVALKVIRREDPPVAMVCGPISSGGYNSMKKNMAEFHACIKAVSRRRVKVFSQMPFEETFDRLKRPPFSRTGLELLESFYLPILERRLVSVMYFIPRWQTSMGASWEHSQAKRLGIAIRYL